MKIRPPDKIVGSRARGLILHYWLDCNSRSSQLIAIPFTEGLFCEGVPGSAPSQKYGGVTLQIPFTKGTNGLDPIPDSLRTWMDHYQALAVGGVRSPEVAAKVDLHLERFRSFFVGLYGHERISTVGRRDVVDWQRDLAERLAPATVNNHLASLSGFATWVSTQEPGLFATGNPSTGVPTLPLPPLEPRSLTFGAGEIAKEPV